MTPISFSDVNTGDWYYDAVAKAVAAGYSKGYTDGTFKLNTPITRAQAAVMIANAVGLQADAAGAADFTDSDAIPAWAAGSIGAVAKAGFMHGYLDGTFHAEKSMTRAEAVSILDRVMDDLAAEAEEENKKEENKKPSGSGSHRPGGGNGGGSVASASEALKNQIEKVAADGTLELTLDANTELTEDVAAEFKERELTLNLENVDMSETTLSITAPNATNLTLNNSGDAAAGTKIGTLEIDAPNATSITLEDSADATAGTEVSTLVINAPNAEVTSDLYAENVNIIAVKDGTFTARDIVKNVTILQGALCLMKGAETVVTIPAGPVRIEGTAKQITVTTQRPVTVNASVETVVVDMSGAQIAGSGAIQTLQANNDATISAGNVAKTVIASGTSVASKANMGNVVVQQGAPESEAKVQVAEGVTIGNMLVKGNLTITGKGTITNMDVDAVDSGVTITVPAEDTNKEPVTVAIGSIVSKGAVTINDKTGKLPAEKTVESIAVDLSNFRTIYDVSEMIIGPDGRKTIDLGGIMITPMYSDGKGGTTAGTHFAAKNNAAASYGCNPLPVPEEELVSATIGAYVEHAGQRDNFSITVLNTEKLAEQIENAEAVLNEKYEISANSGSDIPSNWMWVTPKMQSDLEAALAAAKAASSEALEAKVEAMDALVLALGAYKPDGGKAAQTSYRIVCNGSEVTEQVEKPAEGAVTLHLILKGDVITKDNYQKVEIALAKVEDGIPAQKLNVSGNFDESTSELTFVTQLSESGEYQLYYRMHADGVFRMVRDDQKTLTVVAAPPNTGES